jgi:hypothetical protein
MAKKFLPRRHEEHEDLKNKWLPDDTHFQLGWISVAHPPESLRVLRAFVVFMACVISVNEYHTRGLIIFVSLNTFPDE